MHHIVMLRLGLGGPLCMSFLIRQDLRKRHNQTKKSGSLDKEMSVEHKTEKHFVPKLLPTMWKDKTNKVLKHCTEVQLLTTTTFGSIKPPTHPHPTNHRAVHQISCGSNCSHLSLQHSKCSTLEVQRESTSSRQQKKI